MALARLSPEYKIEQVHQVSWLKKAMHSEIATLELERLLKEAGSDLKQLTHLAVHTGPGSFTGLRVGLNLVRTLAYSLKLPVAGVSSLASLAFRLRQTPQDKIFVAMKAVQQYFYVASYSSRGKEFVADLEPCNKEASQILRLSGNSTKVWLENDSPPEYEAKDLLQLLCGAENFREFRDWKTVEPLYIRASEAEEKLKKQLLKPV